MKKKYLLPPLVGNEEDIHYEECWSEISHPYDFLLQNMKLQYETNKSVFEGGSNAMPHLYEQMIIFQDAFFDSRHPEHDRAVHEWKAVLVIMALQRILNLKVSLKKVDLAEDSINPFLRAAWIMHPETLPVFHQTTWDFLYILCLKDVPIAVFSPITLVCPAKQFYKKVKAMSDRDWLYMGKVDGREKLMLIFAQEEESYASLYFWLDNVKHQLGCSQKNDGKSIEYFREVTRQLDLFIEECKKRCQAMNLCKKENLYPSIQDNLRKEYIFFNNCSDFAIPNTNMEFLVNWYQDDIFQSRLAVITFDERPDSMEQEENVKKLDSLFHNISYIDKRPVTGVWDRGGKRLAAYILLPFKENFMEELVRHGITSDELFEQFQALYDTEKECMEVMFRIAGFPYTFSMTYIRADWKYLYGHQLVSVCLWPGEPVKKVDWKAYFMYAEVADNRIDVSVPGEKKEGRYDGFKLIRTKSYPTYLKLSTGEVTGYLPICTKYSGNTESGAVANLFIDIGHTTTYLTMAKTARSDLNKNNEKRIYFSVPCSFKVMGKDGEKDNSGFNFVPSDKQDYPGDPFIKNAIHSFREYHKTSYGDRMMRPMGDGQVLFKNSYDFLEDERLNLEFLSIEYRNMIQAEREKTHTMLEELLLYAAYKAVKNDCTSLKVHFLHNYENNDEKFGELCGLWENALNWVKSWTGMSQAINGAVEGMQRYEALSWNVLRHVHEENKCDLSGDFMYVGVDIGWKSTILTALKGNGNHDIINAKYADIQYAGLDISTLRENEFSRTYMLEKYPHILSVLLKGSQDFSQEILLKEFHEVYVNGKERSHEYYQGLFDVIAMKIDEENFVVPPDVYNNMEQFRWFLMMMTYNLVLLFVEIGFLLGKEIENEKNLCIYLGGNGSKFLKWISNEKYFSEITKDNSHKLLIVKMKNSILDYLRKGMNITGNSKFEEIRIIMEDQAKQQIVEGYLYKKYPSVPREKYREIQCQRIDDCLESDMSEKLDELLQEVCSDIFNDSGNIGVKNDLGRLDSLEGTGISELSEEPGTEETDSGSQMSKIRDMTGREVMLDASGSLETTATDENGYKPAEEQDTGDVGRENLENDDEDVPEQEAMKEIAASGEGSDINDGERTNCSVSVINDERRRVCRKIIKKINSM